MAVDPIWGGVAVDRAHGPRGLPAGQLPLWPPTPPEFLGARLDRASAIAAPWAVLLAVTGRLRATGLDTSFSDARAFAAEQIVAVGTLREQSLRQILVLWRRFERFARVGHGVVVVGDVNPNVVGAFVHAKTGEGREPNPGTMHLRRSAVRLLFRVLRQFGVPCGDPTLDLVLPPRSALAVRALTDDEIELCEWYSLATLIATRQPAAWALAEAGATTSEVPAVTIAGVDFTMRRVWLAGSVRAVPRWAPLSDWGLLQIGRRISNLGTTDDSTPLVYEGSGSPESRQASSCAAVSDILRRAGLASEPDGAPRSVRAWLGQRTMEQTGRIEEVARTLGLRSLDAAAVLIGFDWAADR